MAARLNDGRGTYRRTRGATPRGGIAAQPARLEGERWHQQCGDFSRYGYFPGLELQPTPPLVYLIAPALRFHPTTGSLQSYLSPEMEIIRVGLAENWRSGLRVMFRQ